MESLNEELLLLVSKTFAGDYGFSGPEIVTLFQKYKEFNPPYLEYRRPFPSRRDAFESNLSSLPIEKQIELVFELCDKDEELLALKMSHQIPPKELREKVKRLVTEYYTRNISLIKKHAEEAIVKINSKYISQKWKDATGEIGRNNERAITLARMLLESVCKHILKDNGDEKDYKGDLSKMLKAVIKLAKPQIFGNDQTTNAIVEMMSGANTIITGMNSITNALATLRNSQGEDHGKDRDYIPPTKELASFVVNISGSLCSFLGEIF